MQRRRHTANAALASRSDESTLSPRSSLSPTRDRLRARAPRHATAGDAIGLAQALPQLTQRGRGDGAVISGVMISTLVVAEEVVKEMERFAGWAKADQQSLGALGEGMAGLAEIRTTKKLLPSNRDGSAARDSKAHGGGKPLRRAVTHDNRDDTVGKSPRRLSLLEVRMSTPAPASGTQSLADAVSKQWNQAAIALPSLKRVSLEAQLLAIDPQPWV